MKAVFFLCSVAFLVTLITVQDAKHQDIDSLKRFIERLGGKTDNCQGNTMFGKYTHCDPRCDQPMGSDLPGCHRNSTVGCGACPKGLIPVDESRNKCVKPEDCP
ncbi:unnamed protein product [Larinioides sclopetarius]|uniref:Uncharacterized protein n=1 Tax=Larinioides sclopetarius TaxID=280406 RepID=A0AAV2AGQ3_9ARAC